MSASPFRYFSFIIAIMTLMACQSNRLVPAATERFPQQRGEAVVVDILNPSELCPTVVEGARVRVEPTPDGAALIMTTERGDVWELRNRAQHLAEPYEPEGDGAPHLGLPAATGARVEPIDGGARLILTAPDPQALRADLERSAAHINDRCGLPAQDSGGMGGMDH